MMDRAFGKRLLSEKFAVRDLHVIHGKSVITVLALIIHASYQTHNSRRQSLRARICVCSNARTRVWFSNFKF